MLCRRNGLKKAQIWLWHLNGSFFRCMSSTSLWGRWTLLTILGRMRSKPWTSSLSQGHASCPPETSLQHIPGTETWVSTQYTGWQRTCGQKECHPAWHWTDVNCSSRHWRGAQWSRTFTCRNEWGAVREHIYTFRWQHRGLTLAFSMIIPERLKHSLCSLNLIWWTQRITWHFLHPETH